MSPTVGELRNEIRSAVGRFERVESAAFTKETLAAICTAVGYEIDTDRLPATDQMRAGILWRIGEIAEPDPALVSSSFRKDELEAVLESVRDSE